MRLTSKPRNVTNFLVKAFFSIILFLIASCNNTKKEEKFVALDKNIYTAYMPFWKYWNEQVFLHEPFEAYDSTGKKVSRKDAIDLLTTGKYFPIRYLTPDSIFQYALVTLPTKTDQGIISTVRQMAGIEQSYLQLEGKELPTFSANDINDNLIESEKLKGNFVILKTWFIKCEPCEKERPAYEALMQQYGGKNVAFISMADDDKKALKAFAEERNIPFVILPDRTNYIRNELGLYLYPTYIIVSPEGKVLKVLNDIRHVKKYMEKLEPGMEFLPPPAPPS
jgi:peroxiredoxin